MLNNIMFWFFKKKSKHNKKSDSLDKIMRSSFYNVKQDISEISSWLTEIHSAHKGHSSKLENYEKRLTKIEQKLSKISEQLNLDNNIYTVSQNEISQKEVPSVIIKNSSILDGLTSTHKHLFKTIYHLQSQLGGNPISFKSLAGIAYVGKDYGQIRSTISQYLNSLYQMGLIDKKRHGKEAYISLTDMGLSIMDKRDETKIDSKNIGKVKKWQN